MNNLSLRSVSLIQISMSRLFNQNKILMRLSIFKCLLSIIFHQIQKIGYATLNTFVDSIGLEFLSLIYGSICRRESLLAIQSCGYSNEWP